MFAHFKREEFNQHYFCVIFSLNSMLLKLIFFIKKNNKICEWSFPQRLNFLLFHHQGQGLSRISFKTLILYDYKTPPEIIEKSDKCESAPLLQSFFSPFAISVLISYISTLLAIHAFQFFPQYHANINIFCSSWSSLALVIIS